MKARWDSQNILGEIEHFDVFKSLFETAQFELLLGASRTPWPNRPHQLSLIDVHLQYLDAAKFIKSRSRMVGEAGPILLVKAMHTALCDKFREPTYGYDTIKEPSNPVTVKLLQINSRAVIILNFMKYLMGAVTFHYYASNVIDEEFRLVREEHILAIENFEKDPEGALLFLEKRALRGMMKT